MKMRLIPTWEVFKYRVEDYINQADKLMTLENPLVEEYGFSGFFYKYYSWIFFCHCYLKYSFDDLNNEFAKSFYLSDSYHGFLIHADEVTQKMLGKALDDLRLKTEILRYILRLLSACDAIIRTKFIDVAIRSEYSIQEIKDLVLRKLYYLSDLVYYPWQTILKGNGIVISKEEGMQIIDDLQKRGFISVKYPDLLTVKISPNGQSFMENKKQMNLLEARIV
jgi:hypothetical protein